MAAGPERIQHFKGIGMCDRPNQNAIIPGGVSMFARFLVRLSRGCCIASVAVFLVALVAGQASAAITFVQSNFAVPQSPQSSASVTYTAAQAAGNLNVVAVGWNDSTAVVNSVTDSRGNVYTRAVGPTVRSGELSQSIYYAKNIVAAAANANIVTVQFNVAAQYVDVRILEYGGIDAVSPVDVTAVGTGSSATSSTAAVATTSANDLLFAANMVVTFTNTPGAGFTRRVVTSPDGDIAEDRIVTTVGSYSATATLSHAGGWIMQMVAFKAAGGPADTTPPTAPSGLVATANGSSGINLTWTASTDNVAVTGYRVERCQGAGCNNFAQVGTPSGTTFADSGLLASTSYSYRVRATDAAGNLSGYSNVSSATTAAAADTTPPTAPSGLVATANGSSGINLTWTASTDNVAVTGYRVERCQGAGCNNFAQVGTPSGTTFADSGLLASTSYSYRVRATDAAGNLSGYSNVSSATTAAAADTTPPTAPSGLVATANGSSGINLTWTASTDNVAVTGYRVERCQGAGCNNFAQVGTPSGTTFADSGLLASTSYSYRVRATDAAGNLSGYSNVSSATTAAAADTTPPTAPSGLVATANGSSGINLTWTASTDNVAVTGYRVERCQGAGCNNFAQVGTPSGTTFADSGLLASTSYSYRVRATDAAGNLSGYSNVSSATTAAAADTTPPTAPSGLVATANGSSGINLTWTASTDNVAVTGYRVERCQGAGCNNFAQVGTPSGTTFADSGLLASTSYSYRVRATDAAGNLSGYSNVSSATTASASGPVAAYSFDAGSGTTVTDLSGNGNNGTIANATWTAAGKYGSALSFNGSTAIVTVSDSASLRLTSAMTLEAWVSPSTVTGAWRDVLYKGNDNYYLEGTSSSGLPTFGGTFGGANANVYGGSTLPVNTWSHLAGTYDGATLRLYVNGALVSSQTQTGTIATSANPLQIGGDSLYGQYFQGAIDEVRVYNRALTQAEIQADMAAPLGGGTPDTTPPTTPSALVATASGTSAVNLTWTASTDNVGVSGYRVERCQGAGCNNFAQVGTPSGTTFADSGLSAGTSYSYRVRAADAAGNLSAYSNVSSATTAAGSDSTPPTAPSELVATANGTNGINLSWTASIDNVGVTGYQLERCQGVGCGTFAQIATPAAVAFADAGLQPNTSYSYRVRATDAAGNLSAYSNVSSATTNADTTPPTAPSGLTAVSVSTSQINLSWTASTDDIAVTAYRVLRCQQTGAAADCPNFVKVIQQPGPATTFSDAAGLLAGTTYRYEVQAVDGAGNISAPSNEASATTASATFGLVAAYSFDEGSGTTTVDLSGNANHGTVANTAWITAGKYGKALAFNGTNAIVTVSDSASLRLMAGMTLEAWVNPSAASPAWRDVIYKGNDNYYLEGSSTNGGVIAAGGTFAGANATLYGSSALPVNAWSHLAATYDGAFLRLYVNGTQISSQALTGAIATSNNPLQIGGDSLYGQFFQGAIDEVRIYNRALAQAEIQADMNAPLGYSIVPPTNLVATVVSATQVNLTWTAAQSNLGISSYRIERCQGTACSTFGLFATTTTTAFSDTTVVANATFRYRVQAVDGGSNASAYSNVAEVYTGLTIRPSIASLTPIETRQFAVTGNPTGVAWSVDGVAGGTVSSGTITTGGLYTPPGVAGVHTVTATSSDLSQSANATVYVTTYAGKFTHHNDNFRTGANVSENVLSPATVNSTNFGKLFTWQLDGTMHASPLYVANVNVPGVGLRNVLYAATEHDSVYAFDADGMSATPLWKTSFINPAGGVTTVPPTDTGECCDIAGEIGITGTPVIDPSTRTLYVVAKTKEVSGGTAYVQRLHALDIATGAEKFGGPVVIQASVPGSGGGSVSGQVSFGGLRENQRPALLLSNGVVYIAFAAHGDQPPYHGWVLGYNAATLQQVVAHNATPDGDGAGIWQSGGGLAADSSGNVYYITGNGTFDANSGGTSYGDSFVKLNASGAVLDYFTPHNQAALNAANFDLGSSGLMLLPDQPGLHPHLALSAGKNEAIHVVDRDNMGHYNSSNDNQIVQSLVNIFPNGTPEPGNYNAPVYFNGTVYFGPVNDTLMAFRMNNGLLSVTPTSKSSEVYTYPGGPIAVSANGTSDGILWAVQRNGSAAPGGLRAYDAGNLAVQLYNSDQAGSRDTLDVAAKFSVPLVANGKVFVGSISQLTVYGLLP